MKTKLVRNVGVAVALVLGLTLVASATAQEKKPAEKPAAVQKLPTSEELGGYLQDVSVTIRAPSRWGGGAEGSGTVSRIHNDTAYILTAGHVVAHMRSTREVIDPKTGTKRTLVEFEDAMVILQYRDDTEGRTVGDVRWFAKVIRYSDADYGEDLAVLEVRKKGAFNKKAFFYLEAKPPAVGEQLYHMGSLLGQFGANSMTSGIMSQHGRVYEKKIYDQTTVTSFPGSSGGGVYTKNGRYCGMVVRGAGEGFTLIVPQRRVYDWAKKAGVEWTVNHTVPVPSAEELAKLPVEDIGISFPSGQDAKPHHNKAFRFLIRPIRTDGAAVMEGTLAPQDPLILRVIRELKK